MELKTLYNSDGEFAIVEPDSQAEQEFKDIGYTEKKPRAKRKVTKPNDDE